MDGSKKSRIRCRCTTLQLKHLVDYMAANPDLLVGAPTPDLAARKEAKMNKLRKILKCYGPDKSMEQWKHTWRDLSRKIKNTQQNDSVFDQDRAEVIKKALENAEKFDFRDTDHWTANPLWISPDEKPKKVDIHVVKQEAGDPLYEGMEYLETEPCLDQNLMDGSRNTEEQTELITPVKTTKNLQMVLEPLTVNSGNTERDSYLQIPSPGSSRSTLPSPVPAPPRKKRKETFNHDNNDVRETYDSGQCDRDIDVLNTLNKFIEYEKEKDRLQHEKEMTRIKQADKLLNVMDKIANVFVELAPSIKNFLDREDSRGDDR